MSALGPKADITANRKSESWFEPGSGSLSPSRRTPSPRYCQLPTAVTELGPDPAATVAVAIGASAPLYKGRA
jgi:hypothetical protein